MRDTEILRRRLGLALTSLGLLSAVPALATGCDGRAHDGEASASHEEGEGEGQPPVPTKAESREGEGEGEGETSPTEHGAELPGAMALDPKPAGTAAAKGEHAEGEGDEFAYYAAPTDPFAVPSDGESADCPQGDWCGPSAKAMLFEADGAERVMGCPYRIAANGSAMKQIDPEDAIWKGLSFDKRMSGRLSSGHTEAQRKERGSDDLCCYHWYDYCAGRPLLDGQDMVVAPTRAGDGWLPEVSAIGPDRDRLEASAEQAQRLAAAWLGDARMEHASVGSFARTTLELMALGAPADILVDVQHAAMDEVRHAERCFALHARYAGHPVEPGALPVVAPRPANFEQLARNTFEEGCVGETIAALIATRAARSCEDAEVCGVLEMIAEDEGEHAALAWRTLAWALGRARAGSGPALLAMAARQLDEAEAAALAPQDPLDAELARHGRLSDAAKAVAAVDAWREIIVPTLEALVNAAHA